MQHLDALLLTVMLIALAAAAAAAYAVAGGYRRAMLRHMTAPAAAAAPAAAEAFRDTPGAHFNLALNRRHTRRLAVALIAISALIGLCSAAFQLLVVHTGGGFGWRKLGLLALTYSWPVVPALGLLWRWSVRRTGDSRARCRTSSATSTGSTGRCRRSTPTTATRRASPGSTSAMPTTA